MEEKRVADFMVRNVITISKDETLKEAALKMRKHRVGSLVVVEGEKPIGIVTERDIVYKLVAEGKPFNTKVEEIMSKDLKTITKDKTLKEAAKIMAAHGIRRLPVVEGEKLIGIITMDDILRAEGIGINIRDYTFT